MVLVSSNRLQEIISAKDEQSLIKIMKEEDLQITTEDALYAIEQGYIKGAEILAADCRLQGDLQKLCEQACLNDAVGIVTVVLTAHPGKVKVQNLLVTAIHSRQGELINSILTGAIFDINHKYKDDKCTDVQAVWAAASTGDEVTLRKLLRIKEVDISAKAKDLDFCEESKTAIEIAKLLEYHNIVEMLTNFNKLQEVKWNNIDIRIRQNKYQDLAEFCEKHDSDKTNKLLIVIAAKKGATNIVADLIKDRKNNINITDEHGNCALWYATYHGYTDIADMLINCQRTELAIANDNDITPGLVAHYCKRTALLKCFEVFAGKLPMEYVEDIKPEQLLQLDEKKLAEESDLLKVSSSEYDKFSKRIDLVKKKLRAKIKSFNNENELQQIKQYIADGVELLEKLRNKRVQVWQILLELEASQNNIKITNAEGQRKSLVNELLQIADEYTVEGEKLNNEQKILEEARSALLVQLAEEEAGQIIAYAAEYFVEKDLADIIKHIGKLINSEEKAARVNFLILLSNHLQEELALANEQASLDQELKVTKSNIDNDDATQVVSQVIHQSFRQLQAEHDGLDDEEDKVAQEIFKQEEEKSQVELQHTVFKEQDGLFNEALTESNAEKQKKWNNYNNNSFYRNWGHLSQREMYCVASGMNPYSANYAYQHWQNGRQAIMEYKFAKKQAESIEKEKSEFNKQFKKIDKQLIKCKENISKSKNNIYKVQNNQINNVIKQSIINRSISKRSVNNFVAMNNIPKTSTVILLRKVKRQTIQQASNNGYKQHLYVQLSRGVAACNSANKNNNIVKHPKFKDGMFSALVKKDFKFTVRGEQRISRMLSDNIRMNKITAKPALKKVISGQRHYSPITRDLTSELKGKVAEDLADKELVQLGYAEKLETKYEGNKGFDLVRVMRDKNGEVEHVLILECKFNTRGSVNLGKSKKGWQMSKKWVDTTLEEMKDTKIVSLVEAAKIIKYNMQSHINKVVYQGSLLNSKGVHCYDKATAKIHRDFYKESESSGSGGGINNKVNNNLTHEKLHGSKSNVHSNAQIKTHNIIAHNNQVKIKLRKQQLTNKNQQIRNNKNIKINININQNKLIKLTRKKVVNKKTILKRQNKMTAQYSMSRQRQRQKQKQMQKRMQIQQLRERQRRMLNQLRLRQRQEMAKRKAQLIRAMAQQRSKMLAQQQRAIANAKAAAARRQLKK